MLKDFPHYKSKGIFADTQWQLTPQSLVESGRNSNSSGILQLPWLPASMKKIRTKLKALECLQDYNYVVFSDAKGQLTPKSAAKFCLNSNSSKFL